MSEAVYAIIAGDKVVGRSFGDVDHTGLLQIPEDLLGVEDMFLGVVKGAIAQVATEVDLADLAAELVSAASAACNFVTLQVVPDTTHQLAYQNAATIVFASGGAAPANEPAKSIFAAQAAAQGMTPAQFAVVVQGVTLVSLELATLLSDVRAAAASAKTCADLAGALTAFEAALSALIDRLNSAGLTVTVGTPPPIAIAGIAA